MQLTKLEREIFNHRLDVPDAIAEAIEADPDAVYDVCQRLLSGEWPDSDLAREVAADAVVGSTYYAASEDESEQRKSAIIRAGESLAEKVAGYVQKPINFPTW